MTFFEELEYRGLIKDISSDNLKDKLNEGGLTFYIGTDPTADSLHIGHLSSFLISKRLKDHGHNPILLVGGGTGLIGDPRPTSERGMITREQLDYNFNKIKAQVDKLFGFEIVNNYDWSKDINFIDYLRDYGKHFSINYMLAKDIVSRRLDSGITYTEFSYMIMQSLDFHHLYKTRNCLLQCAGSDQWGNITAGIDLIRKKEGVEAYGFTMPLVTTKDGTKFGKSEGNALWIDKEKTSSYELYQYLINSEDEMVIKYLKIFTFLTKDEIEELALTVINQPEERLAQKRLALEVITFIHGKDEYDKALKITDALFKGDISTLTVDEIEVAFKDVPSIKTCEDKHLIDLLVECEAVSSKREAREFINNGSILINGEKVVDVDFIVKKENAIGNKFTVIRRGKKKYYLIKNN